MCLCLQVFPLKSCNSAPRLWFLKRAGNDLTHLINLPYRFWANPELLGGFQPTAFIFTLDQLRKSNLVGVYRGDGVCIPTRNAWRCSGRH